jgi:hypothetical protein
MASTILHMLIYYRKLFAKYMLSISENAVVKEPLSWRVPSDTPLQEVFSWTYCGLQVEKARTVPDFRYR